MENEAEHRDVLCFVVVVVVVVASVVCRCPRPIRAQCPCRVCF